MLINVDAVIDVGLGRERNEDAVVVAGFTSSAGHAELWTRLDTSGGPIVTAAIDGMGGHAAGDRASQLVARHLADVGPTLISPEAIETAISDAHWELRHEMGELPRTQGMGATLAAMVWGNATASVVNVGDSRVYEVVDGCLVQVSVDDSPPRPPGMPAEAQMVTVTQALGTDRVDPPSPHLRVVAPASGARFLLCTDGLTDYTSLDDLEVALAEPTCRAADLCRLALDGGGGDNITVALVTVAAI